MLDDAEIDPDIKGAITAHLEATRISVAHYTTQPTEVHKVSSGCTSLNGQPAAGGREIVARPYKPAGEATPRHPDLRLLPHA